MATNDNLSNQPPDGVTGREPTPEEVARHDGYIRGRNDENYVQGGVRSQERVVAQARANDSAASGMVFGLCIALLAAGAGVAAYFLMGDRTDVIPVTVPQIEKEKTTEKETTVIERETSAPAITLPDVNVPDVNIQVPETKAPNVNITNESPEAATEPTAEPAAQPTTENKETPEPATAE